MIRVGRAGSCASVRSSHSRRAFIDQTVMQARQSDVESDDSNRSIVSGDKVQWAGLGQIAVIRKAFAERLSLVVIPWDDEKRTLQLRKHLPGDGVFRGRSLINDVAGKDHEIGTRLQTV